MLELYLVRHGQTACSVGDVYCGRCDVSLNKTGLGTAAALAEHLASLNWTALYASPLPRAQQTIAPLAARTNLPVATEAALTELNYGDWDGMGVSALKQAHPEAFARWEKNPAAYSAPLGETAEDVVCRLRPFIAALREQYQHNARVLCVSHKATLRILLGELLGIAARDFRGRLAQPLGGISVVRFTPRGPLLRTLGDISYLPTHLRDPAGW